MLQQGCVEYALVCEAVLQTTKEKWTISIPQICNVQ